MGNIVLTRVDSRLIHGQVMTKWVNQVQANKIVVVSDELAADEFMRSIYLMSAPTGVEVVCLFEAQAAESYAADVFGAIGTALLSVAASSTMLVFLMGFLQSEGAFTGINIIVGTVTGFLIGAYMPLSMFPEGVQYFTAFIPGSHSAGLFRNFIMGGALEQIEALSSPEFAAGLSDEFSFRLNFFGHGVSPSAMAIVVAGAAVLFVCLTLLVRFLSARSKKRT